MFMSPNSQKIPAGTLFETIRAALPADFRTLRCSKATLVHLSHTLEDMILSRGIPAMLFTGFQESSYWRSESERYQQISEVARMVCIFVGAPLPEDASADYIQVALGEDDPLRQEWFVLVLSNVFSAVLCGLDRIDPGILDDSMRQFDTVWSFDPKIVSLVIDVVMSTAQEYVPEKASMLREARGSYAIGHPDPDIIGHFIYEMIRFEEETSRSLFQVQREQNLLLERELLISTVARTFLDLEVSDLDIAIDSALLAIGDFAGVDRVLLFQVLHDTTNHEISHQWCQDGLEEFGRDALTDNIPETLPHLASVYWENPSSAPSDLSGLAEAAQVLGIEAVALRELSYRGKRQGLVMFARSGRHDWSEHDIYLIDNLAEILVGRLEQRRVETALRESEERFEKVVESIAPYVYVYSILHNGEVDKLYNSPTVENLLGYPVQNILDDFDFWDSLVHPEDLPMAKGMFYRILQGESGQGEYRMRRSDGEYVWVEDVVRVMPGRGKWKYIVYGAINDISERKRNAEIEAESQRLALALESERALGEARNHFMLVVSHEYRTPLSIIMTSASLLEDYYDRMSVQGRKERLLTIRRQVELLRDMMDELAVVVRADMGRLDFKPLPTDLVGLCTQMRDELLVMIGTDYQIDVVGPDYHPMAMLDPGLLRHIIANLLSNAIKYSPAGSRVRVFVYFDAQQIRLSVTDQGRGIPEEDQSRLFQPFVRGSNVQDTGGTGLGLKVVKDCTELHGGTVSFVTQPGQGTTFTVTLPFVLVPDELSGL